MQNGNYFCTEPNLQCGILMLQKKEESYLQEMSDDLEIFIQSEVKQRQYNLISPFVESKIGHK